MFGGELIYSGEDEYGQIQVVDIKNSIRSLHFNTTTSQSAMLIEHPSILLHRYTQAMTLPLLYIEPRRVLIAGLGGGSVAKFFFENYKQVNVEIVELRNLVADIAIKYFCLPHKATNCIYNGHINDWLIHKHTDTLYDLIFIDMFLTNEHGLDVSPGLANCFEQLLQLMSSRSCIVINVITHNEKQKQDLQACLKRGHALIAHRICVNEKNSLIILSNYNWYPVSLAHITPYQARTHIDPAPYLHKLELIYSGLRS